MLLTLKTIFILFAFILFCNAETFYERLGLTTDATTKDIRKAFKKLALSIHPDKNRDDPEAHEKFLKINRAYEVLKDDELRKKYDAGGEDALKDNAPTGRGYESWSFYNKQFGIYDEDADIITLSTSDFEVSVEGTSDMWFINFYSPHCSHCHELAPAWREVARELLGVVRMGAVNCGDDWHLCRQKGIGSYPTLILYPEKKVYQGERSRPSLVKFALDHVHSKVHKLTTSTFYEVFPKSKLNWLIHFCGYQNADCLESITITKLGAMLSDLVNVGTYYCGEVDSVCSSLRIEHGTYFFHKDNITADLKLKLTSYDANEIMHVILQQLPQIQEFDSHTYQSTIDDVKAGIINGLLIHFTDKKEEDNFELRKLPFLLDDIQVGRVDCLTMKQVCLDLHVNKFPTFIIFKTSGGHEFHYGRTTPHDVAAFAKDCRETRVRALGPNDFPAVLSDKKPWFIDFFAPWCPPCMKLLPEFRKASRDNKQVNFGTLDCTVHANLCQMQNVRSYPTAMIFNQSVPHHFNGHHTASVLTDFIQDILKPPVIVLTMDDFEAKVINRGSDEIWLVDFFAPWCGPCQQLAPEWRKLAKIIKDVKGVKIGQLDCQAYQSTCQKFSVTGYPTIRLYPTPSTQNAKNIYHEFNGWMRDANSIRAWAFEFLPSSVTVLKAATFENMVLNSKDPWIVDFYTPWCGHCQVFAPEFEKVGEAMKGSVKAGKINCDENQMICQQAQVRAYPFLRFYKGSTGSKQNILGTEIDSQNGDWIIQHLKTIVPAKKKKTHDEF